MISRTIGLLSCILMFQATMCQEEITEPNRGSLARSAAKANDAELAGFEKGNTVDFNNGDFFAEIGHGATTPTQPQGGSTKNSGILGRVIAGQTSESPGDAAMTGDGTGVMGSLMNETSKMTTEAPIRTADDRKEEPPYITEPLSQATVVVSNVKAVNFNIKCSASGSPAVRYHWYKNDENFTNVEKTGVHKFAEFKRQDGGYYQCKAINKYGTSVSPKFRIERQTDLKSIIGEVAENLTLTTRIGGSAAMRCHLNAEILPAVQYIWVVILNDEKITLSLNDRMGIDSEGTLRFAYVNRDDGHKYGCAITNAMTSNIDVFSYTTLTVTGPAIPQPPKLMFSKKNVKAILGQPVILECFFAGNPPPPVQWKNSTNHVIDGTGRMLIKDYTRKLKITIVTAEDEGTFTCSAGGDAGSIYVNVTSPPIKVEGLSKVVMPTYHQVTLPCKAKAAYNEHLDTPVWYRNGTLLINDEIPDHSRYSFNADRTELTITDLKKKVDMAGFQCNISNSEGYLFYDGYLRVIDSIEVNKKPDNITISKGGIINITIDAKGDTCCEIIQDWFRNNVRLPRADREKLPFIWDADKKLLQFNTTYVIENDLTSALGKYRVEVSNTHQKLNVEFSISLNDDPDKKPITAAEAGIKLWWVAVICGVLVILIAVIVMFVVYKIRNPGDTYALEKTELKHNLNPEEDLLNQSFQDL